MPRKRSAAMTTTGMMTAIAIIPPVPSPEDFPPELDALRAEGVLVAEVEVLDGGVGVGVGVVTGIVEVITSTEVEPGPSEDGVTTIDEVIATTLEDGGVVEGGTTVVDEGGIEVVEMIVEEMIEVVSEAVEVLTDTEVVVLTVVVSSGVLLVSIRLKGADALTGRHDVDWVPN